MFSMMDGYQSPIDICTKEVLKQAKDELDDRITYEVCCQLGVRVEKKELEKALQYDRDQYVNGYMRGLNDGEQGELRRIFAHLDALDSDSFDLNELKSYIKSRIKEG